MVYELLIIGSGLQGVGDVKMTFPSLWHSCYCLSDMLGNKGRASMTEESCVREHDASKH